MNHGGGLQSGVQNTLSQLKALISLEQKLTPQLLFLGWGKWEVPTIQPPCSHTASPPLAKLTELRQPIFSSWVNVYCQKYLEWDSQDVLIKIWILANNKGQGGKKKVPNTGLEFANEIIFHAQFRRNCEIFPGMRTAAVSCACSWLSRVLPGLLVCLF